MPSSADRQDAAAAEHAPAPTRRDSRHASSAVPPTIIHHGSPSKQVAASGSSANLISQVADRVRDAAENVVWIQSSAWFAGVGDGDGQALGQVLLPQDLAADEHRHDRDDRGERSPPAAG